MRRGLRSGARSVALGLGLLSGLWGCGASEGEGRASDAAAVEGQADARGAMPGAGGQRADGAPAAGDTLPSPSTDDAVAKDATPGAVDQGPSPPLDAAEPPADAAAAAGDAVSGPVLDAAALDAAALVEGCRTVVDRGDYVIFAYEASLPDATEASPGVDESEVCSRAGVLPQTNVTFAQATAACARTGFALCTNAQWEPACAGPDMSLFPYGGPHADAVCNDHIAGGNALEVTGNRPGCHTADGIYDLSGNVWEITAESERRGGSWRLNASTYQSEYAGCFEHLFINEFYADTDVGFRCCRGR